MGLSVKPAFLEDPISIEDQNKFILNDSDN